MAKVRTVAAAETTTVAAVTYAAVRVDSEVKAAIAAKGLFGESINDVLRRVLGLGAMAKK